jgi:hypothetical protein
MDKVDFEGQMLDASRGGGRKSRRLAALTNGGTPGDVEDEALRMGTAPVQNMPRARGSNKDKAMWRGISDSLRSESELPGRGGAGRSGRGGKGDDGGPLGLESQQDRQERLMWKGLADAMKEESEEAFIAAAQARGLDPAVAAMQYKALVLDPTYADDGLYDSESADGPGDDDRDRRGESRDGGRRGSVQGKRIGGARSSALSSAGGGGGGGGAGYAMTGGSAGGNRGSVKFLGSPARGVASSSGGGVPSGPAQDFRSYVSQKQQSTRNLLPGSSPAAPSATASAASNFPSMVKPGAFRVASEGGRPGGQSQSQSQSQTQAGRHTNGSFSLGSGMIGSASEPMLPGVYVKFDPNLQQQGPGPSNLQQPSFSVSVDLDQSQADPQSYGVAEGVAEGLPVEVADRDVSFLGGQFVGGGFNLRAGNALRATPLMPLQIADPSLPDVVDNSRYVHGYIEYDMHLYHERVSWKQMKRSSAPAIISNAY